MSTCDKKPRWTQVQKGRRFSGRRPRRRVARRPPRAHDRLSGSTSRERAGGGTRDAIPVLNFREEGTGTPTTAASVLRLLPDPALEGRARHPDGSSNPDDRKLPDGQHRKHLGSPQPEQLGDVPGFQQQRFHGRCPLDMRYFRLDRSFDVAAKSKERLRPRSTFPSRFGSESLLRTITRVIALRNPPVLAGLLHLPHDLPICKGPLVVAISADEFRPRLIRFSSFPLPAVFWTVACHACCLLSIKRPVLSPFSDIGTKRTLRRIRGRWRPGRAEPANTRAALRVTETTLRGRWVPAGWFVLPRWTIGDRRPVPWARERGEAVDDLRSRRDNRSRDG